MSDEPVKATVIISGRREDILAMGRPALEKLIDGRLAVARASMLREFYPDV
jgi:hypothetical protein